MADGVEKEHSMDDQKSRNLFDSNVQALAHWVKMHEDTLPWRKDNTEERRLASFINEQGKLMRSKRLPPDRCEKLATVPGMAERLDKWKRGSLASFDERAAELEQWVRNHDGALPKRTGQSREETSLAHFLNKIQCSKSHLMPERRQRLAAIPGMQSRLLQWDTFTCQSFDTRLHDLQKWIHNHEGRVPKRTEKDPEGKRLGSFLSYLQDTHRSGTLSAERREMLLTVPEIVDKIHGWDMLKETSTESDAASEYMGI